MGSGELRRLAFNFRKWLAKCQRALDSNDCMEEAPPTLSIGQFLKELSQAVANDKKAGLDPEPTLAGLAAIIRRHDRRVAREVEAHSSGQGGVTVNRTNLLQQSHLGRLEVGILELLYKARIANTVSRLRSSQGISLRRLEQRSGVSFSYLSQIERFAGGLPSSEVLSRLDAALLSPSYLAGESGTSLLRQRGDYDTAVQLVQQEEACLASAWLQLMGGISYHAVSGKKSPAVREREAPQGAGQTNPSGVPDSITLPPGVGPVSSRAVAGDRHGEVDDETDENSYAGGAESDDRGPETGGLDSGLHYLTLELCDYFVELTPTIQRALLRLVKDLARSRKGRSRQKGNAWTPIRDKNL